MHRLRHIVILLLLSLTSMTAWAQLNTDRITAIGRNALYFDDYVLSIQYFNQVIRLKPYLYEPYQLRAIAKIQLGDLNGALLDCNRAIELNPFQPGSYYTRGFVYRSLEQYREAEEDFSHALVFSPENKTYLVLRADVRARQDSFVLALQDIDYLLRREPHSPSLLFERGVISMQHGDTLAALDAFTKTTHYDSQNPSNWSALGVTHLMLGNDNEAMAHLTQAINLGSKWAGDYMNRGVIHYRKHNYRGAMTDYDQAVKLSPNDAQVYYNRGMLRHELGDYNNAISDFDHALDLAPERAEIYYQRAVTEMQIRAWQAAVNDLDTLIASYPYFLPSYYLAAQAESSMGDTKAAYQYKFRAYELEQKKDSIQNAQQVNTDVIIAKSNPSSSRDRRKEFSSRAAQNQSESTEEDNQYTSEARGQVQNRNVDVASEANIVLSYYAPQQSIRATNYFNMALEQLNRLGVLPSTLRFTSTEVPLTAEMAGQHFDQIARFTARIEKNPTWDSFFARAIEFALVQDYISAMDDATRALNLLIGDNNTAALITFCRANWRYKQLQYQRATGELNIQSTMDFDIMLRDYDYVTRLMPDFAFAYYNKANMLCAQREYDAAIRHYTSAIEADSDFAEAYFNRGLTYIYTDRVEQGLADLSKAGELGIYQAYNLIARFK